MAIENKAITSTGTDIFICPDVNIEKPQEHAVTCVIFCNISDISNVQLTLTVHVIKNGQPQDDTNIIIKNLLIPAGETFTFDTEKMVLSTGDKIRAIASYDNMLVTTVSSMRVS